MTVPISHPRSLVTKLLHVCVAGAVIVQLASSRLMITPRPSRPPNTAFEVHEWVGILTLLVVLAFWAWTLMRTGERSFVTLFPWFSPHRLRRVWLDFVAHLHAARRLRFPDGEGRPFASAMHGLGLQVILVMAASGTLLWGGPAGWRPSVRAVHEFFANLAWAYLMAHVTLALLHETAGHGLLRTMFGASVPPAQPGSRHA